MRDYFNQLALRFGQGWNRFWYKPSDPLPLCAIRIATGLVALYLHFTFTFDLVYFFGNGGILPPNLTSQMYGSLFDPATFSYLTYLDSPAELYVAHAIGAVVLLLFTLGYHARITSVLALIVTLSYVHRSPFTTSEVEPVLAMLQFYLCLGPCGACLSIDRWLAKRRASRSPEGAAEPPVAAPVTASYGATVAIRLIQLHTCLICLMSGLGKIAGPSELSNVNDLWYDPWGFGDAVWWLIARPQSRLVDLTFLRDYPTVIEFWTHAIVLFELSFGVLIWIKLARPLMLGIAAVMWSSLALISGVPVLSVMMLVANLSFFSAPFLQGVLRRDAKDSAAASASSNSSTAASGPLPASG